MESTRKNLSASFAQRDVVRSLEAELNKIKENIKLIKIVLETEKPNIITRSSIVLTIIEKNFELEHDKIENDLIKEKQKLSEIRNKTKRFIINKKRQLQTVAQALNHHIGQNFIAQQIHQINMIQGGAIIIIGQIDNDLESDSDNE
jgi:hypothetical protein